MSDSIVREMTRWELFWCQLRQRLELLRRNYIPYLVWYGSEMDVTIRFKENRLQQVDFVEGDYSAVVQQLQSGALPKIENALSEIGVTFDKGLGENGRDWEWDFSLRGPVSVKFRGTNSTPERRKS